MTVWVLVTVLGAAVSAAVDVTVTVLGAGVSVAVGVTVTVLGAGVLVLGVAVVVSAADGAGVSVIVCVPWVMTVVGPLCMRRVGAGDALVVADALGWAGAVVLLVAVTLAGAAGLDVEPILTTA